MTIALSEMHVDSWDFDSFATGNALTAESWSYGTGRPGGMHVESFQVTRAGSFGVHVDHDLHQLTWMPGGTIAVFLGERAVHIPTNHAVWIPAGQVHDVAAIEAGRLICVYLRADDGINLWDDATGIAIDGLLRGLLLHISSKITVDAGLNARAVLLDALHATRRESAPMPLPRDTIAKAFAHAFLADPVNGTAHLLRDRTLRRRFEDETGLNLRTWIRKARLRLSFPLLTSGEPVADVADAVGYGSATAFIAAFRAEYGETPGAYRRRLRQTL